ncbi:unnamed protein product [Echinostoma caproni]|uniref:SH3 domain-containing protein n=1 Tax=Echinostoma caproni TaxID=27848 RepID=A0A183BED1_9TREM|nr:unnamed protein product [Echinostoma caproni]
MADANPGNMAIVPMSDVMRAIPQNPVLPMLPPAPAQPMVRVRALYTYDGQHPDDLAFQKGDTMFVLSDLSVEWWFAKHQRTGESGYVPSNYVLIDDGLPTSLDAWYDIGRQAQNFALSVRHYDQDKNMWVVKHYRIRILDDNAGYYISNRINFQNIQDLIDYYSRESFCDPDISVFQGVFCS